MLFLALALVIAEECLIQQTSLAPLVIQLKDQVDARAFGVNYVYLLWALVYESVFVVFAPIYLAELIFQHRREGLWLGKISTIVLAVAFTLGSFLAWFSWTQIARPKVFQVPAYNPPLPAVPLLPPTPWLMGAAACIWATLWFVLVLLAFSIAPQFPPAVAMGVGILLAAAILYLLPR